MVEIAAEPEVFGNAENPVDFPSVRCDLESARCFRRFRFVENTMPYVIGVIMRYEQIIYILFSVHALYVAAHPLAAHAFGGWQKRRMLKILRTEKVAGVIQNRRTVRQAVEHVLAAAGVDEMQVHLAGLPTRKNIANRGLSPTGNTDRAHNSSCGTILQECTSCRFHNLSIGLHCQHPKRIK